mmetsp:Transcript_20357/g.37028  ORF Transcript_20357/g.37028 Transcript_20357/m.37028 type:complete len:510 (-) Transcript_20357:72-1601(-)
MTFLSSEAALLNIAKPRVTTQPMAGVGDPFQQSEDYDFMEESPARPMYQSAVAGTQFEEAVGGGSGATGISLPMSVAVTNSGHRQIHPSPGAAQAILRAPSNGVSGKPPPCDPLGAVMEWLGHADLPDHIGNDDPAVRSEGEAKGAPTSSVPQPGRQVESASARGAYSARPTSASKGRNADGVPAGSKPIVFPRDAAAGLPDRHRMLPPGSASARLQQELESEGAVACFCVRGDKPKSSSAVTVTSMDEETEWDRRKRQTGVSARLVWYQPGDVPSDELVLRGGKGGRIVVTAVSDTGKAAAAGVRPGDVLASIDGKRDFGGHSAETILSSLVLPVAIIFMGFIGKLQAEVRLNHNDGESLGMKVHEEVPIGPIGRPHAVKVVDKVVFSQPSDLGSSPGGPNNSPRAGFSERGSLRDVVAMCDLGPDSRSRSMGFIPQKSATTSGPSSQTAAALAAREPDPLEDGLGPNLSVAPSRLPDRLKPRSESFGSGSWEEVFAGEDNMDTLLTV